MLKPELKRSGNLRGGTVVVHIKITPGCYIEGQLLRQHLVYFAAANHATASGCKDQDNQGNPSPPACVCYLFHSIQGLLMVTRLGEMRQSGTKLGKTLALLKGPPSNLPCCQ